MPLVQAGAGVQSGGATTIQPTLSGVVAGNTVFAFLRCSNLGPYSGPGGGWTLAARSFFNAVANVEIWYLSGANNAGGVLNPIFTDTAGSGAVGAFLAEWSGLDPVAPLDAVGRGTAGAVTSCYSGIAFPSSPYNVAISAFAEGIGAGATATYNHSNGFLNLQTDGGTSATWHLAAGYRLTSDPPPFEVITSTKVGGSASAWAGTVATFKLAGAGRSVAATRTSAAVRGTASTRISRPAKVTSNPFPSADPTRVLRLFGLPFKDFGVTIALTTPQLQAIANYVELLVARSGAGGSNLTQAQADTFRAKRLANGAPPGILIQYDNTGGVPGTVVAAHPIPPAFVDVNLAPANYFNGYDGTIPDTSFIWNQEAPDVGAPYLAYSGGQTAMSLWNPDGNAGGAWVQYLVKHAGQIVSSWFDGLMFDVIGRGFVDNGTDGTNTNPWFPPLQAQAALGFNTVWGPFYVAAISSALRAVQRKSTYTGPLVPNGIEDGYQYFATDAPTSVMHSDVAGSMAEGFVRNQSASSAVFPAETPPAHTVNWQQSVDMVLDCVAKGKVLLCSTGLWPNNGVPTCVSSMQWFRLSLGSYLLAANGGPIYWQFRHDDTTSGTIAVPNNATSAVITGTGTQFTQDFSASAADLVVAGITVNLVTLQGGVVYLNRIKTVDSNTQLTLNANYTGGGAAGAINYGTDSPMNGRQHQMITTTDSTKTGYFDGIPNFAGGVWTGANPDPVNWIGRIMNLDGTLKLGRPVDNYLQPISAQRQTGGGSAYYFRRFTSGLVIVNPTAVAVTALNATLAPISASTGTYSDIGAELSQGLTPNITNLTVPANSAVILVRS